MKRWPTLLCLIAAMLAPAALAAAKEPKPLFAGDEVLHLTIRGPIGRIMSERSREPLDATLAITGAPGAPMPIKLSARGLTRRNAEICQFPPLRVAFVAKPDETSLFRGQKKLKLVTHCESTPSFQQYVLLEYAAYRIYNLLTPLSFRARLVSVDYTEADGRVRASRLGFFVEDESDMAKRNEFSEVRLPGGTTAEALSPRDAARDAVFQYLISNLDWSMTAGVPGTDCCHNTKLIAAAEGATTGIVPAPYDYDSSGLVNAPYALPPDATGLSDVLTRRYRGYCRHNPEALAAVQEIRAQQAAVLGVLDQVPEMTAGTRRKAAAFLGGFFERTATPEAVAENLFKTCR